MIMKLRLPFGEIAHKRTLCRVWLLNVCLCLSSALNPNPVAVGKPHSSPFLVASESILLLPALAETSCVYRPQISRVGPRGERRRDHRQDVSNLSNLSATHDEALKHPKELSTPFIQARLSHHHSPNFKGETLKSPTLRRSCLLSFGDLCAQVQKQFGNVYFEDRKSVV